MPDPFSRYQRAGLQHENVNAVPDEMPERVQTFEGELQALINEYNVESGSGTPDFILAQFLNGCITLFNRTMHARAEWRGERLDAPFSLKTTAPITVYDEHGRSNVIGQAELKVWPGETVQHGPIYGVIPIFGPPKDDLPIEPEKTTKNDINLA